MDVNHEAIVYRENKTRWEQRQFGNQGGRTTKRLNHKEVIFLFYLGAGQAREMFAVVWAGYLGDRTRCTKCAQASDNSWLWTRINKYETNTHTDLYFHKSVLFKQPCLINNICHPYLFNFPAVLCRVTQVWWAQGEWRANRKTWSVQATICTPRTAQNHSIHSWAMGPAVDSVIDKANTLSCLQTLLLLLLCEPVCNSSGSSYWPDVLIFYWKYSNAQDLNLSTP